jgi:hypothetical protein
LEGISSSIVAAYLIQHFTPSGGDGSGKQGGGSEDTSLLCGWKKRKKHQIFFCIAFIGLFAQLYHQNGHNINFFVNNQLIN